MPAALSKFKYTTEGLDTLEYFIRSVDAGKDFSVTVEEMVGTKLFHEMKLVAARNWSEPSMSVAMLFGALARACGRDSYMITSDKNKNGISFGLLCLKDEMKEWKTSFVGTFGVMFRQQGVREHLHRLP